jgi:hypothetical protein
VTYTPKFKLQIVQYTVVAIIFKKIEFQTSWTGMNMIYSGNNQNRMKMKTVKTKAMMMNCENITINMLLDIIHHLVCS